MGGYFTDALLDYVKNPQTYANEIIFQDKSLMIIKDKYPKAQHHFLIIPKIIIKNYSEIDQSHLPLIRNMRKAGIKLIENLNEENVSFRMGFHAVPSLKQLHMHVISEDFNSEYLKSKKHWNSFTTDFFVTADNFILHLEQKGKIDFDKVIFTGYLNIPLKHWLSTEIFPNMPKLKQYIESLQS